MSVAPETVRFLSREAIEQHAGAMRREVDADVIPVDPILIANRLGLTVRMTGFKDEAIAGLIRRTEGGWEILFRESDPSRRVVFTVAHELGHYALHLRDQGHGRFVDRDSHLYRLVERPDGVDKAERSREIQANMFAAALLMPEAEVRRRWADEPSVRGLARGFRVSELAMRFRIDQLGLW